MDPVTQGALGAAFAQAGVGHRLGRRTWLYGAAGGMAADLDIFIRSSTDPLLAIEFHRHFTHSLSFIPVGGALCALPWVLQRKHRPQARWILAATLLGYATHALLDACTTYGTLLGWPFSDHRVSWGFVSIVDLLFTVPLLAAVVFSARAHPDAARARRVIAAGLAWCFAYLGLGAWQHHRAAEAQAALAASRGHAIQRSEVFVSIANQISWRSLYEADGRLHLDKIRVPYFGSARISEGESTPVPDLDALHARYDGDPATARGLRLIHWFASGWIALDPQDPEVITDLRYGHGPTSFTPMWGVRLHPGAAVPVEWVDNTAARDVSFASLVDMVFADAPDALTLEGGTLRPRAQAPP